MIKNIVFDMGNVLVAYDEDLTCRQFMEEGTEEYGRVKAAVFGSQEWGALGHGGDLRGGGPAPDEETA